MSRILRRLARFGRSVSTPAARTPRDLRARLWVSPLEDRVVPNNYPVLNAADTGAGSFRQAILDANGNAGLDTISFDSAFFATPRTITLGGALAITGAVTITSPGASLVTVNANGGSAVFTVSGAGTTTLDGLTITGGIGGNGSGIGVSTAGTNLTVRNSVITGNIGGTGGGIFMPNGAGLLTVQNSTISGNTGGTGGIYFYSGGGLLVQNSTISGNTGTSTATYHGGGVVFYGAVAASGVVIENSTIVNNSTSSTAGGGGINYRQTSGTVTVRNSTITGNTGPAAATGGGGIAIQGSVTLNLINSVVAQNNGPATGPDLRVTSGTAVGSNSLIGVIPPSGFVGTGNLTGTQASPLNPQLGSLANNGGPTLTRAPQLGSPLLNAGDNTRVGTLTTDQRGPGTVRISGAAVDIGAVEAQSPVLTAAGGTVTYTENDPAVALEPTLTISDFDSTSLASARVQITAGLDPAQTDVLAFTPVGAVTGVYDPTTGILTLSGTDTLANYQTALRSVTFSSTSDNPTTAPRTISITATDPSANVSTAVTKTVNVTAVNDAPAFGGVNTATQTVLDSATIAPFATVTVTDPDSASVTVTVTYAGADGPLTNLGGFTGSAGSYSFTGNPAAAQTALRGLTFDPNEAAIFIGSPVTTVFTITVSDGTAPTVTNNQTTVQAVNLNDAPSFTAASPAAVIEDAGTITVGGFITSFTPGPANESSQTAVGYEVQVLTGASLFAVLPAVSPAGVLTYTLQGDQNGTATFQVRVQDSGGTAAAAGLGTGVDTSPWLPAAEPSFTITVNPVNDAPTFSVPATTGVLEDAAAQTVGGFATSILPGPTADEAGQTVNFLVSNDNTGLFSVQPTISPTGMLSYTPAANQNGTATVTVQLMDGAGTADGGTNLSATVTFTITVNPVNDAPSFTLPAPSVTGVAEDAALQTIGGFASAISRGPADESLQTVAFTVNVTGGTLTFTTAPTIAPDGTLTFRAAPDANGTATLSVTLADSGGLASGGVDTSAAQTFSITVDPRNDAPVNTALVSTAVAIGSSTQLTGLSVTEPVDNVPGAAAGYSTTVSVPAGAGFFTGSLFTSGDGTESITVTGTLDEVNAALADLTYTPVANNPSVTITVVSTDGGNTGGGTLSDTDTFVVVVTVRPVITLTAGPTVFTENGPAAVVDAGLTVTDSDSTDLTTAVVTLTGFVPGEDVLTYTGALPAGVSADASVAGQITFTGTAPVTAYEALFRTVTYANTSEFPATTPRAVRFVVTALETGGSTLTSSPASKSIDVTDLNDAPVLAVAVPPTSAFEEATVAVAGVSVSDVDAGTAPIRVTLSTTAGMLAAASAGVTVTANPQLPTGPFLLTLEGPVAAVNAALTSLTFTGGTDFVGTALIDVLADDLGSTGDPGPRTAAGSFSVTVLAVNDAPSFTPGPNVTVNEDSGATAVLPWATNILRGPADEAGQGVTFSVSNNFPGFFTAAPAIDPSGNLTFTVRPNSVGTATVTVTLKDDGLTANGGDDTSDPVTFTITITGVNDTPSFTAGGDVSVTEDSGPRSLAGWARGVSPGPVDESTQTVQFLVTSSNVSSSGGPLFAVLPAVDANGTLTFTPAANANGTASVSVRAMDNGGGADTSAAQTFTITVVSLNDPPQYLLTQSSLTAGPGSATVTLPNFVTSMNAGAPDEVGQTFTFEVANNGEVLFSQQPAISPSGTLTFAPSGSRSGLATVTVRLRDSGGDTFGVDVTPPVQTFTITVNGSNTAPSFTAGPNQTVAEDAGAQVVPNWATNISAGLPAESGQALTFVVTTAQSALFAAGPAVSANGTLTYTPAPDAVGTATVTVKLTDDGGTAFGGFDTSAEQTFTIQLTPVNDPPVFTIPSGPVAADPANGPRTVPGFATGIAAGPADEAGQSVSFLVTTTSGGGLFTTPPAINPATGALTFTPAAGANGTAGVSVRLQDNGTGANLSAAQTFTIVVAAGAQNSPPTAGPDAITVAANSGPTAVPVLTNDSFTPDTGETLSVTAVGSAANGLATLTGGAVFYAPASGFSGTDTFTYTLSDGNGGTATGTVTVTVTPPPVVVVPPKPPTPKTVVSDLVAIGDQTGSRVRVVNAATGRVQADFLAFPGFQGGVNATLGDLTGDGVPDVIVGAGAGGGPVVKVFDGRTFAEVASFHAFLPSLRGGVHVAAADVNGDGRTDLVLGAGAGGGPHVKVVDGTRLGERDADNLPTGLLASFFAYANDFLGGVSVAAADVDGDGRADVVTGAGPGGSPHVKVFDGGTLREVLSVIPYNPGFRGGVNVGAGDLDGDGRAEIITGAGADGGPHVGIYDGKTAASKGQFFAFAPGDTTGVTVAVRPLSAGGATLVAASGSGALKSYTAGVVDDLLEGALFGGITVG